jgi:hypothetical protein
MESLKAVNSPMNEKQIVSAALIKAIRAAAVFNPEVQVAPACILWPDRDRQWEAVIPRLRAELPELLTLGDYAPEKRTGPAIWLLCVIAGKSEDVVLPAEHTPILYLPGASRQDLRAIESCPDHLKPLAELQYRGVIWSQINAKDWTILAFLKSDQGGLGLDVAQDTDAKNAMQMALHRLLDENIELLEGKRLDKDFFNTLLTGGDPVRDLLQWLDQGEVFRQSRGENEWKAFVEVCKSHMAFNPQNEGVLAGAAKFALRQGPWLAVWQRFCEAPKRYPNIPAQIRKCQLPDFNLFADIETTGGWPQWNEVEESSLRKALLTLGNMPPHAARKTILDLEKEHGRRRQLIWAELDESPLVRSLEFLSIMAEITANGLAAGTPEDLATGYQNRGWRADDAVLRALTQVNKPEDLEPIIAGIRAVYLPWAEESARYLQMGWVQGRTRGGETKTQDKDERQCILFVDGLRFDCAKRLAEILQKEGKQIAEKPVWAALPTVTGTGKPAVAPIHSVNGIAEEPEPYNFEPITSYQLKKLLADNGWTLLEKNQQCPSPSLIVPPKLWVEFGDIDHEGHARGWKLAKHIDVLLCEVRDRIAALFAAGWHTVRVVTDHGWLLLPGGLPKIDLPSALAETRWGRCAAIKPGASTEERLYPWFWNPNHNFALANGVSCYRKGEEYAHGGLSLQETLVLELTISNGQSTLAATSIEITDIAWKGMRCNVAVEGQLAGLFLDIRIQAGDPTSSVAMSAKPLKADGTASIVVSDDELEGRDATLVLLDIEGRLVAQLATVIGGDAND